LAAELRPRTASVVADLGQYRWGDEAWMTRRARTDILGQPVSIYEVHLASWMRVPEEDDRFLTYRELAPKLADHVAKLGFTHIELLPICEHPFDGSWAIKCSLLRPHRPLGAPEDFMYFVDYMHQRGIGVLMDWVPAIFLGTIRTLLLRWDVPVRTPRPAPARAQGLGHLIFNYGRNEVRNF